MAEPESIQLWGPIGRAGRLGFSAGLVAILALLSLFLDGDGYLGTDTGGKVATLEAMIERDDWSPDIGYWAEQSDPGGAVHPFFSTRRTEAGWVNITTLPMVYATRLLVGIFGGGALLVMPILGSLLTCLGVGQLSQQFGARDWRLGFLAAATCSPVLVYGLDFWEHSLGLALMVWATTAVVAAVRSGGGTFGLLCASGLLFGAAATMRQEALIYGFVAGLVVLHHHRRVPGRALGGGLSMVVGLIIPLVANAFAERAVIGSAIRGGRALGTVASAGGSLSPSGLWFRIQEGILVTASPINEVHPLSMIMAVLVVAGTVGIGLAVVRGSEIQRPAVICALLLMLVFLRTATVGPTFVPGILAAVPLAGLGLAMAVHTGRPLPLFLGLAPLPLVWATQYAGASEAQWGGRYVLMTGMVLVAFAVATAGPTHPRLVSGFLIANLLLSLVGVSWVVIRSNEFATANRQLAALEADAVVFSDSFIAREGAPIGRNEQWLSAESAADRELTVEVLGDAGIDAFFFVTPPETPEREFPGFAPTGADDQILYGSFAFDARRYERISG